MKLKLWSGLLAAALALSALASMILPAAADAPVTGDIWSVYTLTEDEKGLPSYGVIPNYRYTDDGLFVEPVVYKDFTVQTDHAYSLSEGLFMELRVDDPDVFANHNQVVFHLWNQPGVIVGYERAGSGFYGLISASNNQHYLICMGVGEETEDKEATSVLFGAIKIQPRYTPDGKLIYTMSVRDGGVYFNGERLDMSDKILAFLRSVDSDGALHAGATMCCRDGGPSTTLTLTRFGLKESTAAIPGTAVVPDVPPAETETNVEHVPETKPTDDPVDTPDDPADTSKDPEDTTDGAEEGSDKIPEPSMTDSPGEETQRPGGNQNDDGDHSNGDNGDGAGAETEDDGVEVPGEMAQDMVDLFEKIEQFGGCESALSVGSGVAMMAVLAVCALGWRKKDS